MAPGRWFVGVSAGSAWSEWRDALRGQAGRLPALKLSGLLVLAFFGVWTCRAASEPSTVVINEIMYHPASGDVREEYLELHNPGGTAIDLSGWQFSEGVRFTFPVNTVLPPRGYLAVVADPSTFAALHPGVINHVGGWDGILGNSGETLELRDAAGHLVDRVRFADEGDWAKRVRGGEDYGHRGWVWAVGHDGEGQSLELIDPSMPNDYGQNWTASVVANGTPGLPNSVLAASIAPMILEVTHFPVVPSSLDEVVVTARILAASTVSVTLHWRVDATNPPPFELVPMHDDGLHEDAAAGDGIFGALLPSQPNDTVVEFHLAAEDETGNQRVWPAEARDASGVPVQAANLLYQVDDAVYTGRQPLYKLILTENERAELARIGRTYPESLSNAQMNGTFVSRDGTGTELRYLVGIRNRGHGSRTQPVGRPGNYRVNFRSDGDWRGVVAININARYTYVQHFGAAISIRSGLAGAEARPAQVRVNNFNLGDNGPQTYGTTYVVNEVMNSQFAGHRFPLDSSGNLYRAMRDLAPSGFEYRGEDSRAYTNTWHKATNVTEDDWSDLIGMLRVLGTNDLFSAGNVAEVIDVDQWLRYLAIMALFNNRETSPNTGHNDDYYLYSGGSDRRFRILYYDLDTILGEGDPGGSSTNSIFGSVVLPAFARLLDEPAVLDRYYQILQELLVTTFAPAEFDSLLEQTLHHYVPATVLDRIKAWMNSRRAFVLSLLPPDLPPLLPPPRAVITQLPRSPTPFNRATLAVGGAAIDAYRYGLNGGPYSADRPGSDPIELSDLPEGMNVVHVLGRNSNGVWQVEPTVVSWIVQSDWPAARLNEILARNDQTLAHGGGYPDLIELFNEGSHPADLSGLRLTDNPDAPGKFTFPGGTTLSVGAYLVLYANNDDGSAGFHTGFSLNQEGEGVYLFDAVDRGGALLDAISFGPQLPDYSLGRLGAGDWRLTVPTFGAANVAFTVGDPTRIRLNEWLAAEQAWYAEDFVELYNPGPWPVSLAGLFLTDNIPSAPYRHALPPHGFLGPAGHLVFQADGDSEQGPLHLNFKLASEQGEIGLTSPDHGVIDSILYTSQQTDVSEGRSPDGSATLTTFMKPTPGAPNPDLVQMVSVETNALLRMTNVWRYHQTSDLAGVAWMMPGFEDRAWPEGAALHYAEDDPLPAPANTPLEIGRLTYYFRTEFNLESELSPLSLWLSMIVDDGAAVYLNGIEIHRVRLPPGDLDYQTLASSAVNRAALEGPISLPTTALRPATNTLAVEVHQSGPASTDIVFGLELELLAERVESLTLPIVINEVLARSSATADWVELRNLSSGHFELSHMSLTDDLSVPRKWVFPPGTTIGAGEFLMLWCDDSLPASVANTGFSLDADGDNLFLFDRPERSGALIDSIGFGRQAANHSIGRTTAAGLDWVLTLPTPGTANLGATVADPGPVRINEWMADPEAGEDWFELFNPGPQPVSIGGCYLTDDLLARDWSAIPLLSFIGTGADAWALFIADGDGPRGANHVNFQINAAGESIGLFRASGTRIDSVSFGLQTKSVSQGRFPNGAQVMRSFAGSVSPGEDNYAVLPDVAISEILAHADPPLEDAIELGNLTSATIDIGGWYLSNNARELKKFRIPTGTRLPARGFRVFYQYQFGAPTSVVAFALDSAHGGRVCLSAADTQGALTGFGHRIEFGATANGQALGRHVTRSGVDFAPMSKPTFGTIAPGSLAEFRQGHGAPNAYPLVGPLIVNEIMVQPTDVGGMENPGLEYVELLNTTELALPLFDLQVPTNTWRVRGGIDYDFPVNAFLPPGGLGLLVSFDPALDPAALSALRERYEVPVNVPVYGPFSGRLDNSGDSIVLLRPDTPQPAPQPDAGFVPYVLVDRIRYSPAWPWPVDAFGAGDSLQRIGPFLYGNDPISWQAAAPTAGSTNSTLPEDIDGDDLPDHWEWAYFASLEKDGLSDSDADGLTDLEEFRAGTDPLDASVGLWLAVIPSTQDDPGPRIGFTAVVGRLYEVQHRNSLTGGAWRTLKTVGPLRVTERVLLGASADPETGFYRLVLPWDNPVIHQVPDEDWGGTFPNQ